MLAIGNIHYEFLLLSITKKLGLEASFEFAEFVLTSADHSAIQKKYKEICEKVLTNQTL
jgi:phosphoribosylformylglycinamidine (FGAM) synthase PurS component